MFSIPILWLVLLCNAFIGSAEVELNPEGLRLLEQKECGKYDESQIFVDGAEVALGSRPWMAQIQTITEDYICGGTLISDHFVLTAANCATSDKVHSVRLGDHNRLTDPDCIRRKCMPPFENIDVGRIFPHKNYDPNTFQNDIALIKLAQKVVFKEHISPICLPVSSTLQQKLESLENVFLTGWGQDDFDSESKLSNVLRETKLEYSPTDQLECFKTFPSSAHSSFSTKNLICAIRDQFLCCGISGSPFFSAVEYFGKKRFVQFAVISNGPRECKKAAVLSTNIASFMPWIADVLAEQHVIEINPEGQRLLEQQECGIYDESQNFVNGAEVALGSRPWMAEIQTITEDYICGGTLISDRFVLTSAHCAKNETVHSVRLGDHNRLTDPDCIMRKCMPPSENVDIGRIIIYEKHDAISIGNGIALIELAQKVDFKEHIRPICLPVNLTLKQQFDSMENIFVTGWGEDNFLSRSEISDVLRETKIESSREECERVELSSSEQSRFSICAIRDQNLSLGISGSPFCSRVKYFGKKRFLQFGILTFGLRGSNKASVSSTISFMPWLTNILADQQE